MTCAALDVAEQRALALVRANLAADTVGHTAAAAVQEPVDDPVQWWGFGSESLLEVGSQASYHTYTLVSQVEEPVETQESQESQLDSQEIDKVSTTATAGRDTNYQDEDEAPHSLKTLQTQVSEFAGLTFDEQFLKLMKADKSDMTVKN